MIPVGQPKFWGNERKYVLDCFDRNWIAAGGNYCKEFEKTFAGFIGQKFGLAASSGTTALHLAMISLGIKPGDEVIVPDVSFPATANCVLHSHAKPVFADLDPKTFTISPEQIRAKITSKTKAIIPVHLYGHPAHMDEIMEIAEEKGLFVVEDACQSLGSKYKGRKTGSFGTISCLSFHASKIVTTAEGGILLTNDSEIAEKAQVIRDQGMQKDKIYWCKEIGYNYRMTNIQAAIGVAQMEHIDEIVKRKQEQFEQYSKLFEGVKGVSVLKTLPGMKRVSCFFVVIIEPEFGMSRDEVAEMLKAKGIETRPVYYPFHSMPIYGKENSDSDFPVSTDFASRGIQIPYSMALTDEQMKEVVNAFR